MCSVVASSPRSDAVSYSQVEVKKVGQKVSYNNIPNKQIDGILEAKIHSSTTRNLNNTTSAFLRMFLNEILAVPKKRYLPEN